MSECGKKQLLLNNELEVVEKIIGCFFVFASVVTSLFLGFFVLDKFMSIFDTRNMGFGTRIILVAIVFLIAFLAFLFLINYFCKNNQSTKDSKLFVHNYKKTIFSIIFIIIQFLNWTGFCYSEKRYLADQEIIEKTVAISRDEDLKKEYENNPDCCELKNGHEFLSGFETFLNNLFGYYVYEVNVFFKDNSSFIENYPYYMRGISINSCASKQLDTHGIGISTEEYERNINRIKSN
ncbi:MAG: hypothetical protein ACJAW3_000488 [Lentimonas sp.]|jgi:hypothetical protein